MDDVIKKYENKGRLKKILILALVSLLFLSVAVNVGFMIHGSVYTRLYYFRMDDIESYQNTTIILDGLLVRYKVEYVEVLIDTDLRTYETARVIAIRRNDASWLVRNYVSHRGWDLLDYLYE
ncbi:MAG: hypothetical protein FWE05_06780 [Defluviitaleaceae bacterium]|nr:hypothetical protein [Defluviitaleaceae bacterium]